MPSSVVLQACRVPALLINKCNLPTRSLYCVTKERTDLKLSNRSGNTSCGETAWPPFALLHLEDADLTAPKARAASSDRASLHARTTEAPDSDSRVAVRKPMPAQPPVTMAWTPARFTSVSTSIVGRMANSLIGCKM